MDTGWDQHKEEEGVEARLFNCMGTAWRWHWHLHCMGFVRMSL